MSEIIQVKDRFYILATSSLADEESRVLKHGDTFALFDRHGDIRPLGFEDHGLYHEGTRFLSHFVLRIEGKSPLLLNSAVKEDNHFLLVHLSNPDLTLKSGVILRQGVVYLRRAIFLLNGSYQEGIRVANFGATPLECSLAFHFDADYADIFEVRGTRRKRRGERLETIYDEQDIMLRYRGLDNVLRKTNLRFSQAPLHRTEHEAIFPVHLEPRQETFLAVTAACQYGEEARPVPEYARASEALKNEENDMREGATAVTTSNESFNTWLGRSFADLGMMTTRTEHGLYPYAGIPWYSTIFGRDGIITALETLWINPAVARGVLGYLAARQSDAAVPEQDAEPGKILHEERRGEMAALKEIPFGKYYGTIDATPLFVILAGRYFERTGDRAFLERLWPHVERALSWIDAYGDMDNDGFVEYARHTDRGLYNQGWKDSEDSVFHDNGSIAPAPIALCEVQGYVYDAKLTASYLARALGRKKAALALQKQAETLRERFLAAFWCEDLGLYALALDGKKQPCRVRSSNAGHCLFSGIAPPEHARAVVANMMSRVFFSGWGIRTIASSESKYNPMSYHNGSVWPHDNALIAFGMSRYGFREEVIRVLTGIFDTSGFLEIRRLPELFCGFEQNRGEGPTLYPVACNPQAWASGSVFLLLQACMGLSLRADENKILFNNPVLPPFLKEVHIRSLSLGSSTVDISLLRRENDTGVNVRRKEGSVEVVVTK